MKKIHTIATLLAVASALLGSVAPEVAYAATKCEVITTTCIDGRTGQARVCSSTICRDDKGGVISITTIVLRDAGGALPTKPKLPVVKTLPPAVAK